MSPKSKKSPSPWSCCEKCKAILTQKDIPVHEANCPPSLEEWSHSFIRNDVLFGSIEAYKSQEPPKNISQRELDDMVFMSPSALQLCKIPMGDPVVLAIGELSIVKTAWPTNDKSLTGVSLTKNAMELNKVQGLVRVNKLNSSLRLAAEIVIEYIGKQELPKITTELDVLIKNYHEQRIFSVGNKISIPYYGKKLIYKINEIKYDKTVDESLDEDNVSRKLAEEFDEMAVSRDPEKVQFYKALFSTKWTIFDNKPKAEKKRSKPKNSIQDIGGYDDLIEEIKDVVDIALGKYRTIKGFNVTRGVLLYGTAGVGKSMIAGALISESDAQVFNLTGSEIYSKYVGETEAKVMDIFTEAKLKAPSIILMEDIDSLCPKKSNSTMDQDKRIVATLLTLFDDLQDSNTNVLVLATTSKPDMLDASLRRPGRIDKEIEVPVPTPKMRREILLKFVSRVPNDLNEEDVSGISFVTHGFVGADLYSLCSRAAMHAIKEQQKLGCDSETEELDVRVTMADFEYALTIVKPSAMKEVLIEVPNVKWSDIGGQKDLKLKLKQAVEWPLKHPEAFVRLGITPPRGVLMFGPPGCSKTMIAKALATESKLNFLNIKGPELFSKWVGESERAVREVFRKARQVAPSIIFIDEIDALGGERASSSSSGGGNVQERVLAQLLTELDGVTALGNVTLVAATNRPDRIDKALLRPGRLDRIVYVPLPDFETRREIFNIKLRKMPVSKDVDVDDLVDLTEGYSGAEVQAICHEAAMKALEEDLNASTITKEHFKASLSIVTPRTPSSLIKLYDDYLNKK